MAIALPEIDELQGKYFAAAQKAGCDMEQLRRFASCGYAALPGMLAFHAAARKIKPERREIALDGTRGSAKSHAIIAQVGLDDCQTHPELKFLFLRQTAKAAGESFDDLVDKVLRGVKHDHNSERVLFPNGSKIMIGGFHEDRDIGKYIGIEYDGLVIEEATQIPGHRYEQIVGSVRTPREDWIPRIYSSFNPGGVGHQFYKERFIEPFRKGREVSTWRFFSSYKDNPFIDAGYRDYLDKLTGDLARKWRDADWDIFEGQAFSTWRHDRHVVQPFEIPSHWAKWRAVDWGYSAPWCCLWFTRNPDNGRTYVYREAYQTQLNDRDQARLILDMTPPSETITLTYGDPNSFWTTRSSGTQVTTTAEVYRDNGVPMTRADNDRMNGKRKVDRLLSDLPDGTPGLQVFSNCHNLIRTLPALEYDPVRTEDVDTTGEDHAYDTVRYGLTQVQEYRPKARTTTHVNPFYRR